MNARQTNQTLTERARQEYERPEAHPFRVGDTYENRQGKYEVVEITPPTMTIRYENGGMITANIAILARIWSNLQMPPERPEPVVRGRAVPKEAAAAPRTRRAPAPYQGLTARDFPPATGRGTWRGQVGALIATRLGELTGIPHKAFPVENSPVIYVGREHHFGGRSPEHRAKFLFRLTEQAAEYGFQVQRDSQKMDLTWDWRRFINALLDSESWGDQVRSAMLERGLEAEAELYSGQLRDVAQEYRMLGRLRATAEGLEWLAEGASEPEACTWRDMADKLAKVETTQRCGFYLFGRTPKAEAVASTEQLVERVAQTWAALLPLYSASAR